MVDEWSWLHLLIAAVVGVDVPMTVEGGIADVLIGPSLFRLIGIVVVVIFVVAVLLNQWQVFGHEEETVFFVAHQVEFAECSVRG